MFPFQFPENNLHMFPFQFPENKLHFFACPNPMADFTMSKSDVSALKDTLHAQQQLLLKLYNELEAEWEASATAANETLSVILRLEGEKAAVKMEAEHYKRLSEEKMRHAEESLAIIEDVFNQREMEVAALSQQLQAYRYKLLSMGCTDGDLRVKDSLSERNGSLGKETTVGSINRRNSAPVCYKYRSTISGRDGCSIVEEKTRLDGCGRASCSDKKTDDPCPKGLNSYWEQIRKLDFRVKEIAGGNNASSRSKTQSPSPNEADGIKNPESRNSVPADSPCSTSIYDVFEVPRADEKLDSHEGEDIHPEAVKVEPDLFKRAGMMKSNHSDSTLRQTSTDFSRSLVLVQPRTLTSEYQFIRASEFVEGAETQMESRSREELRLLNEIKEKLDSLHDEVRDLKVKKSSTRDEPDLSVISEAMLYFWL